MMSSPVSGPGTLIRDRQARMRSFEREANAAQNAAKKRGRYGRLIRVSSIQVRAVAGSRKSTRIDFSPAMHELAAAHLGELARRVTFVTRDFREPAWPSDLGAFDAIVTLQAAHETRHKRHLVPLLERARTLVTPGGLLLYADHYLTPETKLPALAPARGDQPLALERAGYVEIQLRHEEGNMALWSGTNPVIDVTSR